jgi:hypothetical protein
MSPLVRLLSSVISLLEKDEVLGSERKTRFGGLAFIAEQSDFMKEGCSLSDAAERNKSVKLCDTCRNSFE